MQLTVPLASAAIIAVIEVISNRNVTNALRKNTMLDMLIMIRNPKAIEVEVVVVAMVVAVVVDKAYVSHTTCVGRLYYYNRPQRMYHQQ